MTEKGYACMSCHQVDTKVVGPSYKDVAAKYAGDASAYDMLAEKIKAGGAGNWGEIAMSPNPTVTDEDMKTILDWIMAFSGGEEAAEEATTEVAPAADTTTEEAAPAESGEATTDAATGDVLTNEQANVLMTEKGYICLTCHDVNVKKVGPTYKEVAAKYAGDATANTALAEKIKAGGVGTWGQIPMPPNPTVSDEDMQKLVTWILSAK